MRRPAMTLAAALALVLVVLSSAPAPGAPRPTGQVLHVPADYPTIADAFADAAPGDTVRLAPDTYYESGLFMPQRVTLDSANWDPTTTVIDGGTTRGRILECASVTGCLVRAIGFQNGSDTIGGAIYAQSNAELTIDFCVFDDNRATSVGGAVAFASSTPVIYGCTFTGNSATVNGGALYLETTPGSVAGCTFTGNHADRGGGAFIQYLGTTTAFTECLFELNTADNDSSGGGGVYVNLQAAPTFTQCRFEGNDAPYGGGALLSTTTEAAFSMCEFEDNVAWYSGGAARCQGDHTEFHECGFLNNSTQALDGGALHMKYSDATVEDSWFYGNEAESGGAIYLISDSDVLVSSCTIVENSVRYASGGAGIHIWGWSEPTLEQTIIAFNHGSSAVVCQPGVVPTVSCCCLYENEGGDWVDCLTGLDTQNGNMTADPNFCGITYQDLSLCADSPCLDDAPLNDCGLLIGAYDEGCADCGSPVEKHSWGAIKSLFR